MKIFFATTNFTRRSQNGGVALVYKSEIVLRRIQFSITVINTICKIDGIVSLIYKNAHFQLS